MQDVAIWDSLPAIPWKEKVALVAFHVKRMVDSQTWLGADDHLKHIFEPGMYIREISVGPGVVIVGRPHLLGHRCELVSGEVMHILPDRKLCVEAPFEVHTTPDYQMVVYSLTDIVARTYHPNPDEIRDIEQLERIWFGDAEPVLKLGALVDARLQGKLCQQQ